MDPHQFKAADYLENFD